MGQNTTPLLDASEPLVKSTSTLVIVPTLVRSASGEFVTNLDARDFRLTDNGIQQKISFEQTENEPLAVVVLMQTGGVAFSQFQNYSKLDTILEYMLGGSTRNVALVTFDSRVEQIWPFPRSVDALYYFLTHPKDGDHGAAIIDAVRCGIGLLQDQPPTFRHIILLLSQAKDDGSNAHAEDVLRGLAESGTTIYSLTFSYDKPRLKNHIAKPTHGKRVDQASSDNLKATRENTAAAMARLSGGQHVGFQDEQELESKLSTLAYEIHNGYTLSFYPSSQQRGLHTIKVEVVNQLAPFEVTARTSYWFDGTITEK